MLFSFPYSLNLLWDIFGHNLETLKIDMLFNFVSLRVSFIITEDIFCWLQSWLQELIKHAVSKNVAFYSIFVKS